MTNIANHLLGRPRTRFTLFAVVAGKVNFPLAYATDIDQANRELKRLSKEAPEGVECRVVRITGDLHETYKRRESTRRTRGARRLGRRALIPA